MRTDPNKGREFTESKVWKSQRYKHKIIFPDDTGLYKYRVNSFSGKESNRLFMSSGRSFVDLTGVSGVDHLGDGRGFALLDFDRDGWLDVALISTNAPRFQLFRNEMGKLFKGNSRLRIKLVGGQISSDPSSHESNRDALGAKIWLTRKSGLKSLQQRQLGEGNVSQNSSWVWVSQPKDDPVESLVVHWPSGAKTSHDVPEGVQELVLKESTKSSGSRVKASP